MVEHSEKNSKYFASLEKKRSETKLISRLKINNKINTNQTEILSETELFYKNLYNKREVGRSSYNFFTTQFVNWITKTQTAVKDILQKRNA